jgi:hypothetical protein
VAQGDEVRHLGKAIHHCKNDRLSTHTWKAFHEIHSNDAPYMLRKGQGLKEAGWVLVFSLVALTNSIAL